MRFSRLVFFHYTINGTHEEMSLPNGSKTKYIKLGQSCPCHFSQKLQTDTVTRQGHLSIHILYQFALLNLSTREKLDDEVIINLNNYKDNMKLHIHIPCVCTFIIHMYIRILKYRTRTIFMTKSSLFNISNKSFHDVVIYLVQ